jgi:threonine dehydrogenase-like Zn-dependent dehydrogenase
LFTGGKYVHRERSYSMKAVAVLPGKPNSIHLADLPEPKVDDIPEGCGVLVEVLRVGVDGTDKEINDAEYGDAPAGYDFLVTGHESFGRVLEVAPTTRPRMRHTTSVASTCCTVT